MDASRFAKIFAAQVVRGMIKISDHRCTLAGLEGGFADYCYDMAVCRPFDGLGLTYSIVFLVSAAIWLTLSCREALQVGISRSLILTAGVVITVRVASEIDHRTRAAMLAREFRQAMFDTDDV
jgi:hypothetical protein